jgi:hypothetical protein
MVRKVLYVPHMSLVATLHRKVTDRPPTNARDLVHYFEYSNHGVEVVADGLKEIPFGEYLVEHGLISRHQLFLAMQLQDRHPAVRIGECVAALGHMQISEVERAYARFMHLPTVHAA